MTWDFTAESFSEAGVRDALRIFGFAVIRNALTSAEISQTRMELDRAFATGYLKDLPTLCTSELLKREPLWRMLFKDGIVRSLRAALGPELVYQHDMDVQRNSYGLTGWQLHTGWHMDAGSETGNAYLRSADYKFVKCGLFLQDFDNGWGGGIRIKPKSHRGLFDPNPLKRTAFFGRRALSRIAMLLRMDVDTFEVPTRAGDLCFFDSRLLHSSAPPSWENIKKIGYDRQPQIRGFWADVPPECAKYVIYWDACNAAMVDDFLHNSVERAASEPDGMSEHRFRPAVFTRLLSAQYPDDFPTSFIATATECGVGIATLKPQQVASFKRKLQTMQLLHP
jgi:hypothetical protein